MLFVINKENINCIDAIIKKIDSLKLFNKNDVLSLWNVNLLQNYLKKKKRKLQRLPE